MPPKAVPQIMLAEWLFVETIDDIRRRSESPSTRSRYELLGIAPLLRKLLIDKHSLIDTVRAARRDVPTDFRVKQWNTANSGRDDGNLPYALRLGGPEIVGGPGDPALSNLQQFIGATVGQVQDRPLTVLNVVHYYANTEGGVHFGTPKSDADRLLNNMAPLLLGQTTGQVEILAYIGMIAVNALTPLRESILISPMIDSRLHRRNDFGFHTGHWTADFYAKNGRTES